MTDRREEGLGLEDLESTRSTTDEVAEQEQIVDPGDAGEPEESTDPDIRSGDIADQMDRQAAAANTNFAQVAGGTAITDGMVPPFEPDDNAPKEGPDASAGKLESERD